MRECILPWSMVAYEGNSRAYQKMNEFSDFNEHRPKDEVWSVDHYVKILEKSDKSLRRTKPLEINRTKSIIFTIFSAS